jgi:hypothetical protein
LTAKMAATTRRAKTSMPRSTSIIAELEKVSGMSTSRKPTTKSWPGSRSKMSSEIAAYIKNQEDEARDTAENKARDLSRWLAISTLKKSRPNAPSPSFRFPAMTSKGRIIGREGRNIRVLEADLGRRSRDRRYPGSHHRQLLRPDPPRNRPPDDGSPGQGWPHPAGPHRRSGRQDESTNVEPIPKRPAKKPPSNWASRIKQRTLRLLGQA